MSIPRRILAVLLLLFAHSLVSLSRAQTGERCNLARDLVVQALEHLKSKSTNAALENALQLLKHANEQCRELGDAWYYRSLVEQKLGNVRAADYARKQAEDFESEALKSDANLFVLASPADAPAPAGPPRDKWALVVGVGEYKDQSIPALRFAAEDAAAFSSLLTDKNSGRFADDHVHLVIGAAATTRRIKSELNWLTRAAKEDDLVVVFFTGHGSGRSNDTRQVSYLLTVDTQTKPQDELFATGLAMVELSNIVRNRIRARRTVIVLDTCHSGAAHGPTEAALAGLPVGAETLDHIREGAGRVIITSSDTKEQSYESAKLKHGYFTYFLLEALHQQNGEWPIDRVYQYLRGRVSDRVQAEVHVPQTPVLSRSDSGAQIVLGIAPSAPGPSLGTELYKMEVLQRP
jgi:hypothetical protein